jgi:TFIIF-interacting CTD phosphatase-like protein
LDGFLRRWKPHFNLGFYTAAGQRYADAIVAKIPGSTSPTEFFPTNARLYQGDTVGPLKVKPMASLGMDLRRVILIDNNALSFMHDQISVTIPGSEDTVKLPPNGVIVQDFLAEMHARHPRHYDDETRDLDAFLGKVVKSNVADVRPLVLKWNFRHGKMNHKHRYASGAAVSRDSSFMTQLSSHRRSGALLESVKSTGSSPLS